MNFQFRLQKALHFLNMKETVKRMEVASTVKRVGFLESRVRDLQDGVRDLLARHPGVETEWAPYLLQKISVDTREAGRMTQLLSDEKKALERLQRELSRLLLRKKGLESLKEKRFGEFRLEESRKEQKRADEAFTIARRYR